MRVILQVAQEVKEGRNYLIFAEGTRSRDGNHLLPFKGGSFKSAVRAQCPIVPVAIMNSYLPFDTNSIKKVTVPVYFLDVYKRQLPIFESVFRELGGEMSGFARGAMHLGTIISRYSCLLYTSRCV